MKRKIKDRLLGDSILPTKLNAMQDALTNQGKITFLIIHATTELIAEGMLVFAQAPEALSDQVAMVAQILSVMFAWSDTPPLTGAKEWPPVIFFQYISISRPRLILNKTIISAKFNTMKGIILVGILASKRTICPGD
ncbi:MAG: hypothetical protein COU81_00330 [Candidatus Portnoybacteria bacterium CG10_big_fil_rev_8_21_14_0_10_36_7]|uniref:Uncharacterized protein n=1 Tax=Candidatus Portnoybacteria bacterium CG10_big_fil_rev_8_21_14_0_10_36_7 TaxID=1974812 RepID=A0A2M8KF15_9BACT|nr:MAG: hypothetical protein COU81_00330 [Candidatus Portnoybacteria bacterium CG10_big_fil_rev_8_21_14_0_10_36_7]